jgi:hypothetical protein
MLPARVKLLSGLVLALGMISASAGALLQQFASAPDGT